MIGAILIDGVAIERVAALLEPRDFYISWTAAVYAVMLELRARGRSVDHVTVECLLRERAQWNDDLQRKLAAAAASVPSSSAVIDYATAVVGLARRREGLAAAARLQEALQAGDLSAVGVARLDLERAVRAVEDTGLCSPLPTGNGWEEKIRAAFRTAKALTAEGPAAAEWIVEPWVAKGAVTTVDGLPKGGGKTTFVMRLVRAALDGGLFLGRIARKVKVVYLTEEPRTSFVAALRRAGLLDSVDLHVLQRPLVMGAAWITIVKTVVAYGLEIGSELLIIDTFPPFAGLRGDDENSAGAVLAALDPLKQATDAGIGIILTRHERKALGEPGTSGRGSNAYTGAVETVVTIRRSNIGPNVRELACLSRFDGVPAALTIELIKEGYILRERAATDTPTVAERILAAAPATKEAAITEADLATTAKCKPSTANRAIKELLKAGNLKRTGKGGKKSPYRYWAPGKGGSPSFSAPPSSSRGDENKGEAGGDARMDDEERRAIREEGGSA